MQRSKEELEMQQSKEALDKRINDLGEDIPKLSNVIEERLALLEKQQNDALKEYNPSTANRIQIKFIQAHNDNLAQIQTLKEYLLKSPKELTDVNSNNSSEDKLKKVVGEITYASSDDRLRLPIFNEADIKNINQLKTLKDEIQLYNLRKGLDNQSARLSELKKGFNIPDNDPDIIAINQPIQGLKLKIQTEITNITMQKTVNHRNIETMQKGLDKIIADVNLYSNITKIADLNNKLESLKKEYRKVDFRNIQEEINQLSLQINKLGVIDKEYPACKLKIEKLADKLNREKAEEAEEVERTKKEKENTIAENKKKINQLRERFEKLQYASIDLGKDFFYIKNELLNKIAGLTNSFDAIEYKKCDNLLRTLENHLKIKANEKILNALKKQYGEYKAFTGTIEGIEKRIKKLDSDMQQLKVDDSIFIKKNTVLTNKFAEIRLDLYAIAKRKRDKELNKLLEQANSMILDVTLSNIGPDKKWILISLEQLQKTIKTFKSERILKNTDKNIKETQKSLGEIENKIDTLNKVFNSEKVNSIKENIKALSLTKSKLSTKKVSELQKTFKNAYTGIQLTKSLIRGSVNEIFLKLQHDNKIDKFKKDNFINLLTIAIYAHTKDKNDRIKLEVTDPSFRKNDPNFDINIKINEFLKQIPGQEYRAVRDLIEKDLIPNINTLNLFKTTFIACGQEIEQREISNNQKILKKLASEVSALKIDINANTKLSADQKKHVDLDELHTVCQLIIESNKRFEEEVKLENREGLNNNDIESSRIINNRRSDYNMRLHSRIDKLRKKFNNYKDTYKALREKAEGEEKIKMRQEERKTVRDSKSIEIDKFMKEGNKYLMDTNATLRFLSNNIEKIETPENKVKLIFIEEIEVLKKIEVLKNQVEVKLQEYSDKLTEIENSFPLLTNKHAADTNPVINGLIALQKDVIDVKARINERLEQKKARESLPPRVMTQLEDTDLSMLPDLAKALKTDMDKDFDLTKCLDFARKIERFYNILEHNSIYGTITPTDYKKHSKSLDSYKNHLEDQIKLFLPDKKDVITKIKQSLFSGNAQNAEITVLSETKVNQLTSIVQKIFNDDLSLNNYLKDIQELKKENETVEAFQTFKNTIDANKSYYSVYKQLHMKNKKTPTTNEYLKYLAQHYGDKIAAIDICDSEIRRLREYTDKDTANVKIAAFYALKNYLNDSIKTGSDESLNKLIDKVSKYYVSVEKGLGLKSATLVDPPAKGKRVYSNLFAPKQKMTLVQILTWNRGTYTGLGEVKSAKEFERMKGNKASAKQPKPE